MENGCLGPATHTSTPYKSTTTPPQQVARAGYLLWWLVKRRCSFEHTTQMCHAQRCVRRLGEQLDPHFYPCIRRTAVSGVGRTPISLVKPGCKGGGRPIQPLDRNRNRPGWVEGVF